MTNSRINSDGRILYWLVIINLAQIWELGNSKAKMIISDFPVEVRHAYL